MDAAAASGRGGPVPAASSQPPRKEWRAVPEHSFRSNGSGEEADQGKSDERTIYEEGRGPLDVDFCSITIDEGGLSEDIARQQQIRNISRRRMELQVMEIELRSQVIARSEILEMQKRFEAQIEENAAAATKLKEQLQEKEQRIHDLEMQIEEKELELRTIKIDNEAAWAKEDLLREQNKELATFRRERDNSEVERAELLKQIHDLREHIQEKENQFLELQEQHRIVQETILFKDERLKEAQAWIARVQMDALQSSTNQSLQAELRERTEQFNQYWGCLVRQYTDMEQHLLQIIQQLQIELAEAREHQVNDDSQTACANSKDSSTQIENKVGQFENDNGTACDNSGFVSNGNLNVVPPLVSASDAPIKSEHVPGIPFVPPVLGMHAFVPPAQLNALHPFVMHPQGALHSVSSTNQHISQSQLNHLLPIPAITSNQGFPSQQEEPKTPYMPNQNQHQLSHTQEGLLQSDALYSYEPSGDRQVNQSDYSESSSNPIQMSGPISTGSVEEVEVAKESVLESYGNQYLAPQESLDASKDNSKSCTTQGMNMQEQENGAIVHNEITASATSELQRQVMEPERPLSAAILTVPEISTHSPGSHDVPVCDGSDLTKSPFTAGETSIPALLDEKSLLACIVRAVPTGSSGRIRISSTLLNRLGKMLAPLEWHDYKKQYGKLDDFVGHHPELFIIEGDFIHLREGAQKTVSAKFAAAKFAAATAASAPCLPQSVVVTPVAQGHRLKRSQSTDGESVSTGASMQPTNSHTQPATIQNQQMNGFSFNIAKDLSDVNTPAKSKDLQEANVFSSATQNRQPTLNNATVNGRIVDQSGVTSSQSKSFGNGRHGPGWRQQGRATGAGLTARR